MFSVDVLKQRASERLGGVRYELVMMVLIEIHACCGLDDDFVRFRRRADLSQLRRRCFESQHTQQRDRDPDEKHNVCMFYFYVLGCTEFSENSYYC